MNTITNNTNATSGNIILSKKELLTLFIFIIMLIIFCYSINQYYFMSYKMSKLHESDNETILYPSEQNIIQGFTSPNNNVKGFMINLIKDDKDTQSSIYIELTDENYNPLDEWEITSSDASDNYFLQLSDNTLKKNTTYYLIGWADKTSTIGIIADSNTDNGYKSFSNNGLTWKYQIVYNAFSSATIIIEIIFIILIILVIISIKQNVKEELLLSLIYICISAIFFIITPINTLFDEEGHFIRSYEIAHGHLVSDHSDNNMGTTMIPENLYDRIISVTSSLDNTGANFLYVKQGELLKENIDQSKMHEADNPNQALYSPGSYIPQVLGLLFANITTDNIFLYYFYGRFAAFFINTILIVAAINLLPDRRRLIFILSATPLFLSQIVSYSADGNLNSLSIFYAALIINNSHKEQIRIFNKIIIFICGIIISLSKVIYFPLVLLVLILQNKNFKNTKNAIIYKISSILSAIFCFTTWFMIAQTYLFDGFNGRDIRPSMQMKYIITHPLLMISIVFRTIYHSILDWIGQISGATLATGLIQYSYAIWVTFTILIAIELFTYSEEKYHNNSRSIKVIIGIIVILICVLTFSSLYVQWTPYKAMMISGIQGRYFIPLIIPISYIINRKYIESNIQKKLTYTLIAVLMADMFAVVNTFQIYM